MEPTESRPGEPEINVAAEDRQRASRRAAILGGLGKGTAALAALSPLASRASGSHKVANSTNPGGFGYCSESGFQSAVISQTTGVTICSAFAPSHFVAVEALSYSTLTSPAAISSNKLADALNAKYPGNTTAITTTTVGATLLATTPLKLVVPGANLIILPNGSSAGIAIKAKNMPSGLNPLAQFKTLFTSSQISASVLEVLYEGVVSASPARASCYYASAYLTVFSAAPTTLPASFNKTYLNTNYKSDADVAKGSNEYNFYQAVCVAP